MIISVIGLIITVGVIYAFFNYTKEGTTGTITFLYTEVSKVEIGLCPKMPSSLNAAKKKKISKVGNYILHRIAIIYSYRKKL